MSGARGAGAGAGWPRSAVLVAAKVVVVALLDVAELPLQGLLGARTDSSSMLLDCSWRRYSAISSLAERMGFLVLLGRLGELGVAALKPLFGLGACSGRVTLELGADLFQRRRDVRLQVIFALHGDV